MLWGCKADGRNFSGVDIVYRAKEAEVTLLRAAMTGRDISLRNANIEAAEAQAALRTKDEELQAWPPVSAFFPGLSQSDCE